MARVISIYNNFLAPSGYITVTEPHEMADGKKYSKIWSPIWDIIIKKGKEDIPTEDKKDTANWTWYSVVKNKVMFYIDADKVVNFFEYPRIPSDNSIYVIGGKKNGKNKVQDIKTNYSRRNKSTKQRKDIR